MNKWYSSKASKKQQSDLSREEAALGSNLLKEREVRDDEAAHEDPVHQRQPVQRMQPGVQAIKLSFGHWRYEPNKLERLYLKSLYSLP